MSSSGSDAPTTTTTTATDLGQAKRQIGQAISIGAPAYNSGDIKKCADTYEETDQDIPPFNLILLSAAFWLCLCGAPQLASAAADINTASPFTSIVSEQAKITSTDTSTTTSPSSISNYFSRVVSSPTYGAKPMPTDSRFDNADARNRAYDQAYEQDARDRDAYYGKMAMLKRERALRDVSQNRRALGLDGDGDVRLRVGEKKVAGMASLKEYVLQQDPSTLTPEELKVYQRMLKGEQINEEI
jgi:hypothetical protein